jgi:hypothetical protein
MQESQARKEIHRRAMRGYRQGHADVAGVSGYGSPRIVATTTGRWRLFKHALA